MSFSVRLKGLIPFITINVSALIIGFELECYKGYSNQWSLVATSSPHSSLPHYV